MSAARDPWASHDGPSLHALHDGYRPAVYNDPPDDGPPPDYEPPATEADLPPHRRVVLTSAADIEPRPVFWLWDGRLALGTLGLLAGREGLGKSTLGYWLAAHGRGRGAATHAVRLLTGWALVTLGLQRIQLTCAPDNVASQAVAERCGFTREGVLRSHLAFKGGRRDTVVYGLVAGDR